MFSYAITRYITLFWTILISSFYCSGQIEVPPSIFEPLKDNAASQSADTAYATISSVGDIMVHQTQLNAQLSSANTYDFNNNFDAMRPLLKTPAITIANLETVFGGPSLGFMAYPRFNTPDELANAIDSAGVNLVTTTNNHCYDQGNSALLRTLDVLKENGLESVGTRKKSTDKNYVIREVNGIRIGITAYTYESGKKDSLKTINGLVVPKNYAHCINSFDPYSPQNDLPRIKGTIDNMRADSADVIVFIMHWGKEYEPLPNEVQLFMTKHLNAYGVDVIFGSHPHVVQPFDLVRNDSTGNETFVAYSMGNFISNQRYETMQNYATEDGLFVGVEFIKPPQAEVQLKSVFFEPTWVNRAQSGNRYQYEILPVHEYLERRDSIDLTSHQWKRIEQSKKRTNRTIQKLNVQRKLKDAAIHFYEYGDFLERYRQRSEIEVK